jgi:hypothetical protein
MDDGKITSIKPVSVFDVTQTQERTPRAVAKSTKCAGVGETIAT